MCKSNKDNVATLDQLLQKKNVQLINKVANWQEAVRISLKPLEKGGFVDECYAENIIKDVYEVGPYFVLTDKIALIHGRPEKGAITQQLAITVLKKPVFFLDSTSPVRILFALAAENADSHIEAIKLLATFCMDESNVDKLLELENVDDIYKHLMEV